MIGLMLLNLSPAKESNMDKTKVASLFRYSHLPEHLQEVSKSFHDLAMNLVETLPASAELTLAVRTLWEAKNLAVFAKVEQTIPQK